MGTVMKNCRNRKMKNALPNQNGTVSGRYVLSQPNCQNSMKLGINSTYAGSIRVARVSVNSRFLPGNRKRANAYPASEDETTVPVVAIAVSRMLFQTQFGKNRTFHTSE